MCNSKPVEVPRLIKVWNFGNILFVQSNCNTFNNVEVGNVTMLKKNIWIQQPGSCSNVQVFLYLMCLHIPTVALSRAPGKFPVSWSPAIALHHMFSTLERPLCGHRGINTHTHIHQHIHPAYDLWKEKESCVCSKYFSCRLLNTGVRTTVDWTLAKVLHQQNLFLCYFFDVFRFYKCFCALIPVVRLNSGQHILSSFFIFLL